MGVVIVLAFTVAGPRIGVVTTTAFYILGQFALATVIDRRGWFGFEEIALTWPRAWLALWIVYSPMISSGRTGMRVRGLPVAARIAATTAAEATTVGASPTPFTP
ncbi:MAG: hypothetical protein EXQ81_12300 [Thermoleophilia bacterium]|nr:hypothetical protein [Thermoleophilia bacterium]